MASGHGGKRWEACVWQGDSAREVVPGIHDGRGREFHDDYSRSWAACNQFDHLAGNMSNEDEIAFD